MSQAAMSHPHLPAAHTKSGRRLHLSPVWLVPIVAALLVAYLVYKSLVDRGPAITITFRTADGLVAGQTQVKHKAVTLGTVDDIRLSKDMTHVDVRVRMDGSARSILTDHARFWVVRPRLNPAASLSGLETLVSGAYIEVDPGQPGGHEQRSFTGLEEPPGVRSDEPGKVFVVKADRLGALTTGSPVFYRDAAVGEVLTYELGKATDAVAIRVFVRAPYDAMVHADTRFWNTSGVTVEMGPTGLHLELESLRSLLAGGISFETPTDRDVGPPSADGASFDLYANKAQADASLYQDGIPCVTYFESSIAGLAPGAPVVMFGVQVGTVSEARLVFDQARERVVVRVAYELMPRLALQDDGPDGAPPPNEIMRALVDKGVRVVLESNNLLTGQQLIALEYVPHAKPTPLRKEGDALVLPGQAGGLGNLTNAVADIAAKLDRIPFDSIGAHLDRTIRSLDRTVSGPEMQEALVSLSGTLHDVSKLAKDADRGLGPALERLPEIAQQLDEVVQKANAALGSQGYGASSDFQRNLTRVMTQINEAARTIRILADFLERHPEAILRGRSEGGSR